MFSTFLHGEKLILIYPSIFDEIHKNLCRDCKLTSKYPIIFNYESKRALHKKIWDIKKLMI